MRRMVGIFTAITAALLVAGVAWAAGDGDDDTSLAALDVSGASSISVATDTSLPSGSSSTSSPGASSSTSSPGASSSTSSPGSSSSTSTPGSSSSSSSPTTTTPGSSTSTTVEEEFTAAAGGTFQVAPGVTVTVGLQGGALVLVGYSAPGWQVDVEVRSDRIRIEFEKGSSEARFEAELDDGRLEIEIRRG